MGRKPGIQKATCIRGHNRIDNIRPNGECLSCYKARRIVHAPSALDATTTTAVSHILDGVLADLDPWAEGDALADDGIVLDPRDLARHLAEQLTPPLMAIYRKQLARHRANRERLLATSEKESKLVAAAIAVQGGGGN